MSAMLTAEGAVELQTHSLQISQRQPHALRLAEDDADHTVTGVTVLSGEHKLCCHK